MSYPEVFSSSGISILLLLEDRLTPSRPWRIVRSIGFYCDAQSSVAHFSHLSTEALPFLYCSWSSPLRPSLPSTPLYMIARSFTFRCIKETDELGKQSNPHPSDTNSSHSQQNRTSKNTNGFFRIPLRHLFHLCRASTLTSALYPHRC